MAKNLDIIKGAMKKIHALASGAEPTAAESADGMAALQSLIVELIGQGSLGRLRDVLATSDYTAKENERVRASTGVTVTIPTTITPELDPCGGPYDYGFRSLPITGTGDRVPRDRACIVVIDSSGVHTDYVYNALKGAWVEVQALGQQDDFPFADYLEDGFKALLAERIADDFDQELGAQTALQAARCRQMLAIKPDSASLRTMAEYF
jgi:hypothetical protein